MLLKPQWKAMYSKEAVRNAFICMHVQQLHVCILF